MRDQRALARWLAAAGITLAVLVLSLAAHARAQQTPAPAAASPSFDELYRRGQKANAGITSLTASFTETASSTLLDAERPIVWRGTLYVQRTTPPRVAMHYHDPDRRFLVIDGNRMINAWPARKLFTSSDITRAQRNVEKYFGAPDPGELRRIFDIDLHDVSERRGTHEVFMVPKRRQISDTLKRLELWVDQSSALLSAMRMTFANGDTKLMEFEDVSPNAAIDPAVFSVPK